MRNQLIRTLHILTGSVVGAFLGHAIYTCWDYQTRPALYDMQPAPWYTSIWVSGVFTISALLVIGILKYVVRKKTKANENARPSNRKTDE
ncbi:MAG: hypothetical protein ACOX6U_10690 [Oscillospiraceae bacterium]